MEKILNEKRHDSYSSPKIIGLIKPRTMRWAGHVTCTVHMRNIYRNLVEEL